MVGPPGSIEARSVSQMKPAVPLQVCDTHLPLSAVALEMMAQSGVAVGSADFQLDQRPFGAVPVAVPFQKLESVSDPDHTQRPSVPRSFAPVHAVGAFRQRVMRSFSSRLLMSTRVWPGWVVVQR